MKDAENRKSMKGNETAKPGKTETVEQVYKDGHGIHFPIPDHPDHSEVDGDGGIGTCKHLK